MKVVCPECGSKGILNAQLAGQLVRCSQCGGKFVAKEVPADAGGGKWYYAAGEQKMGPVSEDEFARLIAAGTIAPTTLVWRKGMPGWQALAEVKGEKGAAAFAEMAPKKAASPDSAQPEKAEAAKGKTAAGRPAGLVYGGNGKRLAAKLIDLVFMGAMATMVDVLSRKLFPESYGVGNELNQVYIVTMLIVMSLGMFYITWFVGKFGATPGKMVFSLKVVRPTGGKVSYGQAFGRYWAEFVVIWMLTLMLGYLPIPFDPQRRGLHDRLCNTRVVKA